jgi:Amt family ammonium transporter
VNKTWLTWAAAAWLVAVGSAAGALAQEAALIAEESAAAATVDETVDEAVDPTPGGEAPPALAETPAVAEAPAAPTLDKGDNAWMLVSSALVLFMTAPGLAMFYSGLVRKKNVLGVMMQCIFLMGLMTVVWALYGYSLAFGGSGAYLGGAEHLFMRGVQADGGATRFPMFPGLGIPMLTHMLFQGMFFIITPGLICGAFAERMKFSAMVVFSVLWGTFVYCPLCHWVWDGGILAYHAPGTEGHGIWGGALDFAGGTVVHISSGISALVCAAVLGRRLGFGQEPMPPHNLTYTALGTAMLWVGWFGFNAGSALAADGIAASAFATTHFSAAAGTLAWALMEWLTQGKPTVLGACSGAVAGLVCITPAAGFVQPMPALAMGALAGVVCQFACSKLKKSLGYDDSLDAFGVHGVGGTLGAVLTGIFATNLVWDIGGGARLGLLEGGNALRGQLAAVGVTWVFSIVVTYVLLKLIDGLIGLRVSREQEMRGLDITQHGEEGYIML